MTQTGTMMLQAKAVKAKILTLDRWMLRSGKPFRSIQGKIYVIDGDEFVTDDDPKGDKKIDQFGNLLGGE
jgi:chromatin structure-remodeling complex protein RSC7